ncbi:SICA antigen [Plasmodium coatneyi]|uniref:SICA antigen n=1 Tax=Plasmodium coatneyi TaxID=208452 RepID=A0A1B1E2S3_9APIC|nr:SICA antigen [Plasmodium coatneyi]ANQ09318.1 SICA antigen [Plasmodium coatneyi]
MDSTQEFENLKKEWFGMKGWNEGNDGGKLLGEMAKWIGEMHKNLDQKDIGIAETGCEMPFNNEEKLKEEDMEWCKFILGHLWGIKRKTIEDSSKEPADIKMKEFIRCEVLNMWLHTYMNKYCGAGTVMTHAYGEMNNLCGLVAKNGECSKCQYRHFGNLHVNNKSVYPLMMTAMRTMGTDVNRMYNKIPKDPCPQRKSSEQAETAQPKITAEHFHFITELLIKWMMAGNMDKVDNFGEKIWEDIKELLQEFFEYMEDEDDAMVVSCKDVSYDGVFIDVKEMDRLTCKLMVKALFFVNRFGARWKNEDGLLEEEDEIRAKMRCIIVGVLMFQTLKANCERRKGMDYALKIVDNIVGDLGGAFGKNKCKWMDYEDMKVGGKIIGKTIKEWLLANEQIGGKIEEIGKSANCKWEDLGNQARAENKNNDSRKIVGILKEHGEELEKEEKTWTVPVKLEDVKYKNKEQKALSPAPQESSSHEQPQAPASPVLPARPPPPPPPSPPDEDCSKKTVLCERAKCVTTQWGENRILSHNIPWDKFWPNDVKNQLKSLSKGMLQVKPDVDNECDHITGADSTNKEACKFIVRGLEHIYKIEKVKVKDNLSGDQKRKKEKETADNQIFHRTVSCFLLNAYIDRLKQEVKSPCTVDEETIQQAFDKGNGQRTQWCKGKDKEGKSMDCEKCERVPSLVCEVTGGNKQYKVKEEVDKLFQDSKNVEAQKVLTAINTMNNLCHRANCVVGKWFKNRTTQGGSKTMEDMWGDVGYNLGEMSEAMNKNSATKNNLCEKATWGSDETGKAKKKACELLVKGLKHIYSITKYSGDNILHQEDNRRFKQTMACLALNAYADKLSEQSCIEESVVQEAFKIDESLRKSWCTGDACEICKREKDYKNCKISWDEEEDEVKGKVDELLKGNYTKEQDKKQEIKNVMNEIDTICQQDTGAPSASSQLAGSENLPEAAGAPAPVKKPSDTSDTFEVSKKDAKEEQAGKPNSNSQQPAASPDDIPDLPTEWIPDGASKNDDTDDKYLKGAWSVTDKGAVVTVINGDPIITAGSTTISTGDDTPGSSGSGSTVLSSNLDPGNGSQVPTETKTAKTEKLVDDNGPGGQPSNTSVSGSASTTKPGVPSAIPDGVPGAGGGGTGSGKEGAFSPPAGQGQQPPPPPPLEPAGPAAPETSPTTPPLPKGASTTPVVPARVVNKIDNLSDLLTSYLPTIPVFIGISAMTYLLWKYFFFGKRRKRYIRAHQVRRPPTLQEQLLAHVEDQGDGPHEYTLVKERKQPRSAPKEGKTRRPKKHADRRISHRAIIDIHLEVLDECQREDLHSTKEDYFAILVQEFMGSNFLEEKKVPKKQVPSLDSGFRVNILKGDVPEENVPSSDSEFREEDFLAMEGVPLEDVHSLYSGFREEDFILTEYIPEENIPKESVPMEHVQCSVSGFKV